MASLKDTMQSDLTSAMRSHHEVTVRTLRMVLTSITAAQVAGKSAHELTADEEVALLSTELKRRQEAAAAFAAADRPELAAGEEQEADVIRRYLPAPLSPDEVSALVAAAVAEAAAAGQTGGRAMGTVMKTLKPQTSGRVDGGELAAAVKSALGIG